MASNNIQLSIPGASTPIIDTAIWRSDSGYKRTASRPAGVTVDGLQQRTTQEPVQEIQIKIPRATYEQRRALDALDGKLTTIRLAHPDLTAVGEVSELVLDLMESDFSAVQSGANQIARSRRATDSSRIFDALFKRRDGTFSLTNDLTITLSDDFQNRFNSVSFRLFRRDGVSENYTLQHGAGISTFYGTVNKTQSYRNTAPDIADRWQFTTPPLLSAVLDIIPLSPTGVAVPRGTESEQLAFVSGYLASLPADDRGGIRLEMNSELTVTGIPAVTNNLIFQITRHTQPNPPTLPPATLHAMELFGSATDDWTQEPATTTQGIRATLNKTPRLINIADSQNTQLHDGLATTLTFQFKD